MRRLLVSACAALVLPGAALAAVCEDRTPPAITTVAAASLKCQEKIALEGGKFLRAKLKALSACKVNKKIAAGGCPTAKDVEKIEKAAATAAANIAKACDDDAAQAGLASSYASLTDPAPIASCMLSQHNVIGEWIAANANGATTEAWPGTGKERASCIKEINKTAWQVADLALKHASNCIKTQMKNGVAGDLAPVCVGSFAGGAYVPPTDVKTAAKITKLFAQIEGRIAKKCGPVETLGQLETLFACPGATSVAGLQSCVVCNGFGGAVDALEQQYVETGELVAHGTGAIQAAVDAASAGDKLLIASGQYAEEVLIQTNGLKLVGCGGATDDRPVIVPPSPEGTGRGIQANGVDGLVFQSIATFGQALDGMRISLANGVTFRDVVGDGNLQSAYAIFPVTSNDVLIELCKVTRVDDAPLYVGQSSGIVVRFNDVRDSVAGIEIENCGNAQVYGNYATNNTAGLLVFKDGSLPVQLSQCHEVHHNLFEANNTPNFGSGTVAGVPAGTGMLVISNDTTPIHHNVSRNNRSFGLTFVDQQIAEFGPPFSADSVPQDNYIFDNVLTGNGSDPDFAFGADAVALFAGAPAGNCQSGNVFTTQVGFTASLLTCTLPPPAFPSCPAPPVP
ncbi:MAG: parallel beta-helix domain-containing protein [Thermodesulfobacteriota bacterium]